MSLILVGYWRHELEPEWPDPREFVDTGWKGREAYATWLYLSSGTVVHEYMGYSSCRFCGQDNGTREFTDGTYLWPEGLAHYIQAHQVRPPEPIVEHAVRRLHALEDEAVDREWWLNQTAL